MTDKEINTNKYFVELTDIGGGTIGYTVPFPEELLREIIKQNKQLKRKEQECEELKEKQKIIGKAIYKESIELCNENARYRKALEEIEKYCENQISITGDLPFRTTASDILDIIYKAKEE